MTDQGKYRKYAEKVAIFHGLVPEEVEYILHQGKILHYRAGETVFHQGQLGTNLFIVLHGQVAIYNKTKLIAELSPGDAFGEMAVLNRKPRNATAAAITESKLFTLDEKQINQLLEKHVAVRLLLNIIHMLSERLERANTLITDLRAANGVRAEAE
jgi:CRP/FNR family transcriptional regulator, cyclic AMP receptor protein